MSLALSVRCGDVDGVKKKLAAGYTIDTSLLHIACGASPSQYQVMEIVALLLEAGAEVNARGSDGYSPLHIACIVARDHRIADLLLKSGANPNTSDIHGETPLHGASRYNSAKTVELLLDAGADLSARDLGGNTPLHDACRNDGYETAVLLLAAGANRSARNARGGTPAEQTTSPKMRCLFEPRVKGAM